jgi:hypothetical protein
MIRRECRTERGCFKGFDHEASSSRSESRAVAAAQDDEGK